MKQFCFAIACATAFAVSASHVAQAQHVYSIEQSGSYSLVEPISGAEDIVDFYGYGTFPGPGGGASGNIGLETDDTSLLFLYEDTTSGEASLVMVHDRQNSGSGGRADFKFHISGGIEPVFSVKDDPGEVVDPVYPNVNFIQSWRWNNANTDGAALTGGLESGEWCITIDASFPATGGLTAGSIAEWVFLTGDGALPISLALADDGQGNLSGSVTICRCLPVADPDVKTQGFWKRVCDKPHPSGEHELIGSYVDAISSAAPGTFGGVASADDVCDELNPNPKNDKCEQAEAQFMALLLNIASGRVSVCNSIEDPDLGSSSVGAAVKLIDAILSDNPSKADCTYAQSLADLINNGVILN